MVTWTNIVINHWSGVSLQHVCTFHKHHFVEELQILHRWSEGLEVWDRPNVMSDFVWSLVSLILKLIIIITIVW